MAEKEKFEVNIPEEAYEDWGYYEEDEQTQEENFDKDESEYYKETDETGNTSDSKRKRPNYTKDEKKLMSTVERLEELKKRMKRKPPRTVWGKNKNLAKIHRLENIIKIQQLKTDSQNLTRIDKSGAYDEYFDETNGVLARLSDVELEMDKIATRIDKLKERESEYKGATDRVRAEKPADYVAYKNDGNKKPQPKSKNQVEIDKSIKRYKEMEKQKIALEAKMKIIKQNYADRLMEIAKQNQEAKRTIKTQEGLYARELNNEIKALRETTAIHPIQSFKKFGHEVWETIKKVAKVVKDKVNEWNTNRKTNNEQKRAEAQSRLDEAISVEDSFSVKLRKDIPELTLEQQNAYTRQIREKFTDMKQEQAEERSMGISINGQIYILDRNTRKGIDPKGEMSEEQLLDSFKRIIEGQNPGQEPDARDIDD